MRRLELGSGQRASPGYETSDINAFDGIDYVCSPENLQLPSNSFDEILALGVIEHLEFAKVDLTISNAYRLLKSGGIFLFDVPDLYEWCKMYVQSMDDITVPFTREHILSTLYGWQRWPGDTHVSGHSRESITKALNRVGFHDLEFGVHVMTDRGHKRNRFERPEDAHIYCCARKE